MVLFSCWVSTSLSLSVDGSHNRNSTIESVLKRSGNLLYYVNVRHNCPVCLFFSINLEKQIWRKKSWNLVSYFWKLPYTLLIIGQKYFQNNCSVFFSYQFRKKQIWKTNTYFGNWGIYRIQFLLSEAVIINRGDTLAVKRRRKIQRSTKN